MGHTVVYTDSQGQKITRSFSDSSAAQEYFNQLVKVGTVASLSLHGKETKRSIYNEPTNRYIVTDLADHVTKEKKMHRVLEATGLPTYKLLLQVLGDFCQDFPMTGVDKILDAALAGRQILPTDKRALGCLGHILSNPSVPAAVQDLQNKRFSDLPVELKPVYKDGRKLHVAFWVRGNFISDKVRDLLAFDGATGSGHWCDQDGVKVSLINLEG